MKTVTIVNPVAGHGKTKRHLAELPQLLRRYDLSDEVVVSQSAHHVQEVAKQAAQNQYDLVIVCGGDGTLHYAINGLYGSQTALGILPMGSGNDLAGALGIPANLESACSILKNGRTRSIDLGDTGDCVYACVAGVGFDSAVVKRANQRSFWLRGPLIYSYAVFQTLLTFRPKRLRLTHDAGVFDDDVMFAVVGNTMRYGGGMRIVPLADPEDGLLDVCIVRRISRWTLLKSFPSVFRGGHIANPYVVMFRSRCVSLESDEPLELFGDGEYLENTPSQIRVVAQALRVVTP